MAVYQRSLLESNLNQRIYNKKDILLSVENTVNNAAREVLGDIDLRSFKRKYSSPPKVFTDIYEYTCPTDLKAFNVIDLQPQVNRSSKLDWIVVPEEEFDRRKAANADLLSFTDRDLARKFLISSQISDDTVIVGNLDNLTADGGTWALFGDGTNLSADTDNFVKGSGSVMWDISAAGGTTAGIENTSLATKDISVQVDASGRAFAWIYITSTTNLTNWILRLGSSSTAYHQYTATTQNDGTAFTTGWNLIGWSLASPTDTGSPDDDNIDYAAIYMTKTAAKVSETQYRCDWLVVKAGDYYNIIYYSKYPWQNTSGTWLENSTSVQDYVNCDTEEFNLFLEKAVELAALELREDQLALTAKKRYDDLRKQYLRNYKSEKLKLQSSYWESAVSNLH